MSADSDLSRALMDALNSTAPLRDAVDGYRADMVSRGYSPTAAEAMAMDFHRHLLDVAFSQVGK